MKILRIGKCLNCTKDFPVFDKHPKTKHCSFRCAFENRINVNNSRRPCLGCGKNFYNRKGKLKFCSIKCKLSNTDYSTPVYKNCLNCGKEYKIKKSREKLTKFCSYKCMNKFKSATKKKMNGYIFWRENGKRIWEHRTIMEQFLGRKLSKNEIVHHKNNNRSDNRIENLQILNQSEHMNIHRDKKLGKFCK